MNCQFSLWFDGCNLHRSWIDSNFPFGLNVHFPSCAPFASLVNFLPTPTKKPKVIKNGPPTQGTQGEIGGPKGGSPEGRCRADQSTVGKHHREIRDPKGGSPEGATNCGYTRVGDNVKVGGNSKELKLHVLMHLCFGFVGF